MNCYLYNKDKDYIIDGKFTISIKPDIKDVKISDEQDKYLENVDYLNAIHFLFRTVKLKYPPKLHVSTRWRVYDIHKLTGLLKWKYINNSFRLNTPDAIEYSKVELAF